MNQTFGIGIALFVGVALGAGAVRGLHAQAEKKPAYVVAEAATSNVFIVEGLPQ